MTFVEDLRDRLVYSRPVGRAVLLPLARWGLRRFDATSDTPHLAYVAMRKLYGNADPSMFEALAREVGAAADGDATTPGGGIADGHVDEVVAALRSDGYAVVDRLLDDGLCSDLEAAAKAAACAVVGPDGPLPGRRSFDPAQPVGLRYDLDEADVLRSRAAQLLVTDPSLLEIATRYLRCTPVQDLVAMWWSAPLKASNAGTAAAAQQFHFDLDRLRFVKVFVFLTDVGEGTGPHLYVRGSHRDVPSRFRHDRRHTDEAVLGKFGDDVMTITGPRGTVFLADTRGLHKGRALKTGHRLMFQTEYAISLFGAPYDRPVVSDAIPQFLDAVRRHPETFRRFAVAL